MARSLNMVNEFSSRRWPSSRGGQYRPSCKGWSDRNLQFAPVFKEIGKEMKLKQENEFLNNFENGFRLNSLTEVEIKDSETVQARIRYGSRCDISLLHTDEVNLKNRAPWRFPKRAWKMRRARLGRAAASRTSVTLAALNPCIVYVWTARRQAFYRGESLGNRCPGYIGAHAMDSCTSS